MIVNQRHQAFLDEYFANGMNATAAYKVVYPDSSHAAAQSSSSDLVRTLKVEIERRQAIEAAKNDIKKEELIADLKKMIEDCKKDNDRPNMIKAINLLARMGGHFNEGIDVNTGTSSININLNLDTPEDNKQNNLLL